MESQSTAPRIKVFGTWAEQTSSSGKRYYYNSATNVSQWDKPAEWKQAEKLRASSASSTAAVVKNERGGGSASVTPTDKVSPTSSSTVPIAKCLPNAFVTNSALRQFRQSNLAASTFSSSPNPMSTKADSSAAIVMNSASPLPSAAKRQRLMADEDGCAMSANLGTAAPIHGGKKPNILLNQQQQVSSTTADSAAMDGGESNHRTDRNVTPTTTAFSSSSPSIIGKPANRPHMQAIQSTSNSAANRDQQQRLSSSPVKLASSYGNAAATEQTISSTGTPPSSMNCGATTPFPTKLRSLMSIGTSSPPVISSSTMMMMASSGAGRQQQQQTCSTSNGTMTTTADGGRTQHQEKEMTETRTEIFREEKYQKYWRPELTAQSRRALGTDAFANEMRKCVDRANKQTASNFGLERDIHSICTLEQIAFLRTELCKQRLNAVQQRIQELGERTT